MEKRCERYGDGDGGSFNRANVLEHNCIRFDKISDTLTMQDEQYNI